MDEKDKKSYKAGLEIDKILRDLDFDIEAFISILMRTLERTGESVSDGLFAEHSKEDYEFCDYLKSWHDRLDKTFPETKETT